LTAAEGPCVDLTVPDPGRSWQRWQDSPYAQAWQEVTGGQPTALDGLIAQGLAPLQLASLAELTDLAGPGALAILPPAQADAGPASIAARLAGPALAERVLAVLAQAPQPAQRPDGWSSARQLEADLLLGQDAQGLVLLSRHPQFPVWSPATGDGDAILRWDLPALHRSGLLHELPEPLASAFAAQVGQGRVSVQLTPRGLRQEWTSTVPAPGAQAVDRAVFAKLPAAASLVVAWGVDGAAAQAAWRYQRTGLDAAGVPVAMIDGWLAEHGVPGGIDQLAGACTGTMAAVSGPGGLLPSMAVLLPRSAAADTAIEGLLRGLGTPVPAAGAFAFVQIPVGLPQLRRLAPGLAIGRDAGHWILGLDSLLVDDLAQGRGGGWDQGAGKDFLAAQPASACVLGWADGKGAARLMPMAGAWLAMGLGVKPELAPLADLAQPYFHALARRSQPATAVAVIDAEGTYRLVVEDLAGGLSFIGAESMVLVPVLAGMLIPAIGQVRRNAQSVKIGNNLRGLMAMSIAYSTDIGGQVPDLETLLKAYPEDLPPAILVLDPSGRVPQPHILFVNPDSEVPAANHPILVSNPACANGTAVVCFGDSHIETFRTWQAQAIWAKAQELSRRPDLKTAGVSYAAWNWDQLLGGR
jgi:hypothetical protein